MGWKQTGHPAVRQQRGRWVVRVDGVDTTSGRTRPRQLGTYASKRAAQSAATAAAASGAVGSGRGTVGWLVDRWVASRTGVAAKTRLQYEWAAGHIETGLGRLTLDRLDREDIAGWLERLAAGGEYSKRSIQIMRTVLRAALADATDEGLIRRNAAARVPMPHEVVRPTRVKEVDAWDDDQVERFLAAVSDHRWSAPLRLAVLYGVRRSELLALRWSDLDLRKRTVRVDEGLVEVRGQPVWTEGKNARSRRSIPIDTGTAAALTAHRKLQAEERLLAGPEWSGRDLVVATRTGQPMHPGNFDQTLDRLVLRAGVPRLTSHGLRHTAATHMVRQARDAGELRAVADVLGHKPRHAHARLRPPPTRLVAGGRRPHR